MRVKHIIQYAKRHVGESEAVQWYFLRLKSNARALCSNLPVLINSRGRIWAFNSDRWCRFNFWANWDSPIHSYGIISSKGKFAVENKLIRQIWSANLKKRKRDYLPLQKFNDPNVFKINFIKREWVSYIMYVCGAAATIKQY